MNLPDHEAVRFDELLVHPIDGRDPAHDRRVAFLRGGGIVLILTGFGFISFFIYEFERMYFRANGDVGMHFAQFYGLLGDTISGSVALMGLGGLIYSFAFLADQVEAARLAYLKQDMPIVFVAPRLYWRIADASNRTLNTKDLSLAVGVRNVGEAAATYIKIDIIQLSYKQPNGEELPISMDGLTRLIDSLPGREAVTTNRYQESVEWQLTDKCPNFLDAIFHEASADADAPSLRLEITVSFNTIRGATFHSSGSATWSPRRCRDIRLYKQRNFLNEFTSARRAFEAGGIGLDKYTRAADENPLATIVETSAIGQTTH